MNATELQALADLSAIVGICCIFAAIGALLCVVFLRGLK